MQVFSLVCDYCGGLFLKETYPSVIKHYKQHCCSKRCAMLYAKSLSSHAASPTGEVITKSNHIMVRAPEHPYANKNGQVHKARLILEESLSRILGPKEIVHHIDGNPLNNNVENLLPMTFNDHRRLHSSQMRRDPYGRFTKQSMS